MKLKLNIKKSLLLASVFLILYLSSGYTLASISGTLIIGLSLLVSFLVMILVEKRPISIKLILIVILMCIIVLLSSVFSGDSIKETLIMLSAIVIAVIFVVFLEFEVFCELYLKVIFFISSFSLFSYIASIIFPSFIRLFPTTYYRAGREVYNLGFTVVNLALDPMRNMGIFWEPGAYQTYLVFAIMISIFIKNKNQKLRLIIFTLALITTLSTTGFIAGFFLLLVYILNNNKTVSSMFKIIMMLIILTIMLLGAYSVLPIGIQYALIGKYAVYLNDGANEITSTSVRIDGIIYPLKAFLSSPLLGVGYDGLYNTIKTAGHSMATNTPMNWFGAYGFFYGVICISGILGFAKRLNPKKMICLLVVITFLLAISSEQYLRNTSIYIFILYGFSRPLYNKEKILNK